MGHPIGIPISQNYDSISTAGPVLWSFGGMEVDKDGKTVRINSPATEQMVEWYKKMYRDCMEPEVLSWTDASNNESLQQGKAGWIHNPVAPTSSRATTSCRRPTASTITGAWPGPSGQRHETDVPRHIGIWKFSKNIEPAKEWIRYLLGKREVYDEYIMSGDAFNLPVYANLQDHPVLKTDPKFAPLKQEGVQFHCYGWPAPASDKVQLITNSFILPNMIAKAVTGTSTKDSVAWARQRDEEDPRRLSRGPGEPISERGEHTMDVPAGGCHGRRGARRSRRSCVAADARQRAPGPRRDPRAALRRPRRAAAAHPRRLSVLHGAVLLDVERLHRAAEPVHRAPELREPLGERRLPADVPERLRLHRRRRRRQARAWASRWPCF